MHLMRLSEKLSRLVGEMTQADAAARLGVNQATIARWVAGDARPYPRHLNKIAEVFGVPVEILNDDAAELSPMHIMRLASQAAKAAYPENELAADERFDSLITESYARKLLSEHADQLLEIADSLERRAKDLRYDARALQQRAKDVRPGGIYRPAKPNSPKPHKESS